MHFLKDKRYLILLGLAPITVGIIALFKKNYNLNWYLEKPLIFIQLVFISSVVEEVLFRGIIQEWIKKRLRFDLTNILTSLVFCLAHTFYHSIGWSFAVLVPSLIFGYSKEVYKTLKAPIILHIFYNFCYFMIYEY